MNSEQLKPCRKCGNEDELWIISDGSGIPDIKCNKCKHSETALTWNFRAGDIQIEELRQEREKLAAILKEDIDREKGLAGEIIRERDTLREKLEEAINQYEKLLNYAKELYKAAGYLDGEHWFEKESSFLSRLQSGRRSKICPECRGAGHITLFMNDERPKCPRCNGTGVRS